MRRASCLASRHPESIDTGQVFTFAYGGTNADQFYLASLTAAAVPEPESLALMLAGLVALGVVVRRRLPAAA